MYRKIINNFDGCPVCLENFTQYQGFYKCKHSFCTDCYKTNSNNNNDELIIDVILMYLKYC